MAEELTVYEPGDRFATISTRGTAHIWEIGSDGEPVNVSVRRPPLHEPETERQTEPPTVFRTTDFTVDEEEFDD